ncbi:MAG: hypothetical protein HN380_06740 [Victivallales bacterium]|jgi:phosphohistidine phosphatase|nr:hypothetical protein [Victivallales bacterium]
MKMLLLLRHGKSPQEAASDWERPLGKRARKKDVPLVAQFVQDEGVAPEWIISSNAHRARATAEIFAAQFPTAPELVLTRDLYLASPQGIADAVQSLPDSVCTAVVVGHNAGLEMFAEELAEAELPADLKPGGLCVFQLAIDTWLELRAAAATLSTFVNPADLRS